MADGWCSRDWHAAYDRWVSCCDGFRRGYGGNYWFATKASKWLEHDQICQQRQEERGARTLSSAWTVWYKIAGRRLFIVALLLLLQKKWKSSGRKGWVINDFERKAICCLIRMFQFWADKAKVLRLSDGSNSTCSHFCFRFD